MKENCSIFVDNLFCPMEEVLYKDEKIEFSIKDEILICNFLSEIADFDLIDFGIRKRLEIASDKPRVMISDVRNIKKSTREGRQRLGDAEGAINVIAVGIIMNTKVQQVMYNFFNSIYKQPAPARVFTNKEDAIAWIKQYIPKADE